MTSDINKDIKHLMDQLILAYDKYLITELNISLESNTITFLVSSQYTSFHKLKELVEHIKNTYKDVCTINTVLENNDYNIQNQLLVQIHYAENK